MIPLQRQQSHTQFQQAQLTGLDGGATVAENILARCEDSRCSDGNSDFRSDFRRACGWAEKTAESARVGSEVREIELATRDLDSARLSITVED